ncbi:hypothetical protein [Deinococcus sp. S9]|uniref:hypothetical protein n=1 Tax=Deinococcus sp. S9 TaxID=2545754 RepID=UPI0010558325|nr:hypothetical protein [Deinococcus sp. S9]TDE87343.1 hypothetical protein E0686_02285 [Deinococcus sp. S9]
MARKSRRKSFWHLLVPGSTGSTYTLIPGALGFFAVLWVFLDSYVSCRNTPGCTTPISPGITGELLTAVVAMLGVHTVRAALADRQNANLGYGPVPVEEDAPPVTPLTGTLPEEPEVLDPPPTPKRSRKKAAP